MRKEMQKSNLVLRIWAVLALMLMLSIGSTVSAQTQDVDKMVVTLSMKQTEMKTFLDEVSKQTGLQFDVTPELLSQAEKVNIDAQAQPVRAVLGQVFNKTGFSYSIDGNSVKLVRKPTQEKRKGVYGQVTDKDGLPLPGVTIRMKGFNGGYITNLDGQYEINTDLPEVTLTFNYIGYKPLEKKVKNGTAGNFTMQEDVGELGEVVVTGFATKNRNSFTGSQVSIKKDELLSVGTKNVLTSLANFVPGLSVLEDNLGGSDPNKIADINIRGRATFSGQANLPVFVVDGSQVKVDYVNDMDMNDIESITVLKDASASALYGAKASAGVIVITTKALKGGKLRFNYNGTLRLSTPDLSDYKLLSASQKLEYERLAGLYTATDLAEQYALQNKYAYYYNQIQDGVTTDWIKKPLRNALSSQHSVSIDGGDEHARYNLGVRYGDEEGVMKGSSRERLSTNFKLSYNLSGKFFISNTATISSVKSTQSPYGDFSEWVKQNPYEYPYDEYGALKPKLNYDLSNPLYEASLGSFKRGNTLDVLNTTTLQLWLGEKFRIDGDFSIQKTKYEGRNFVSPFSADQIKNVADVSRRGLLKETFTSTTTYQGKLMVSYNNYIFSKLFLTTMAGATIESNSVDGSTYGSVGYYSDNVAHPLLAGNYPTGKPGGVDSKYNGAGFFVNLNTIWDNRYFLDVIYRYEGSSKFGKNSRFAPFWSVGTGWNIHNEKFLKGSPFQLLKLRASLGYLGNISFEPYQALTMYTSLAGLNYIKGIGAVPMGIGNKNLKWERTLSANLGLDLTMFKGRWDFSADVYVKNTDNLLLDITKAPSLGITTSRENVGEVENRGFEFQTRVIPIKNKDWEWSLSLNYAYNKNKIKKISNALREQNEKNQAKGGVTPLPIYEEGQSLTALKVVSSAGIDPITGNEVFIKRDGSLTFVYDPNDKVVYGDTTPFGMGSIGSYLTYKQFSMGMSMRYSFGGAVYNQTLASKVEGADPRYNADERVFSSRWKEVGQQAKYKRISDSSVPMQTSRFVETNNYITLSSLSLAYEVPLTFIKRYGLKRLHLEMLANDLFYLSSVKRERGLSYPYERSVEFSVRLGF